MAGQALVAAGRTVPDDRPVHSLHAYFLRPGDPSIPLLYRVDAIRDGRSFTTRRVVAIQHGKAIFTLAASFHRPEEGFTHQVAVLDAPSPEDLPRAEDVLVDDPETQHLLALLRDRFPVDIRFPERPPRAGRSGQEGLRQRAWVRSSAPLPDDPLVHACAATYVSDLFLLGTAVPPHDPAEGTTFVDLASLDHAVWFHAPFRADEWLLYEQEGVRASGGRALARGTLFDASGTHVASVTQEGLIRVSTIPATRTPADRNGA